MQAENVQQQFSMLPLGAAAPRVRGGVRGAAAPPGEKQKIQIKKGTTVFRPARQWSAFELKFNGTPESELRHLFAKRFALLFAFL